MNNLASFFNHFFITLSRYCTPCHCHHCDTPIIPMSSRYALCSDCQKLCTPKPSIMNTPTHTIHATFEFTGVIQTLLHSLKFEGNTAAADHLIPKTTPIPTADVVIPVPSHPSRIRHRGFDHIETLFRPLYGNRYYPCIQRIKKTPPLYNKSAETRKKVLRNAFQWNPEYTHNCKDQSILIVDDIYTSGSTINAMIQCIKHHCKPKAIAVFALCRKL